MVNHDIYPPTGYVIAGPTGSGKSRLALALASKDEKCWHLAIGLKEAQILLSEGEKKFFIINGDSIQLYRDLSILTACPTVHELSLPFFAASHLYQILSYHEMANVQWWINQVDASLQSLYMQHQVNSTKVVPLIIGGSGMYLDALTKGISPIPSVCMEIKKKVNEYALGMEKQSFYHFVINQDPLVKDISPNDLQRLSRALEVYWQSGISIRIWQKNKKRLPISWKVMTINPNREDLKKDLFHRCKKMLEQGAIEEVDHLRKNVDKDEITGRALMIFRAIGFRQICAYLENQSSFSTMLDDFYHETCQYAKRQFTWFNNKTSPQYQINNSVMMELRDIFSNFDFFNK
jgi:tRNA dimethylallyltransferase